MSAVADPGVVALASHLGTEPIVQHPCARCARVQRTCCQRAEILVTDGDVGRIAHHTGRRDFAEFRAPLDPAYVAFDEDDPNWSRLTVRADGTRHMLVRRVDGDCTFLGAAGCTLPTEVRPLVCRLYPFVYTELGITGIEGEYCPTSLLAPDGRDMAAVLGIPVEDARRWHGALYAELREESRHGAA
ncbi:MAG: YkgJ family cysteine cluster protein [Planctomycetota bacterium]